MVAMEKTRIELGGEKLLNPWMSCLQLGLSSMPCVYLSKNRKRRKNNGFTNSTKECNTDDTWKSNLAKKFDMEKVMMEVDG